MRVTRGGEGGNAGGVSAVPGKKDGFETRLYGKRGTGGGTGPRIREDKGEGGVGSRLRGNNGWGTGGGEEGGLELRMGLLVIELGK